MKRSDWTKGSKWILGSAFAAAAGCLLLCMAMGALVSAEILRSQGARWLCLAGETGILTTACWTAANRTARSKLPVSLAVAAVFLLLCLVVKAAVFSAEEIQADWRILVPVLAAVAAGLLASRRKKRR